MNGQMVALDEKHFRHGTIREIWKNNIEVERWFDPAFQEFINKELASVA
jgi:hypothetical protein